MADAVTSQVLHDGPQNLIMRFTNVSDATGEAAVPKVDPSTVQPYAVSGHGQPRRPTELRIEKIAFKTFGMSVEILWHATADVRAFLIPESSADEIDFEPMGGLSNNAGAGKNGNIKFTTVGAAAGDRYDITLWMRKVYAP